MRRWGCLTLLLLLSPACVAPARSTEDFEHKAVDTAEAVLSSVQTGLLVTHVARERAFGPYVSVALSDAEAGAASATATFLSLQPPEAESDEVRAELSALLDQSDDALSRARIAARRGDLDALLRSAGPLSTTAASLERFITRFE
jgi:hypothetical protein